MKKNSIRFRIFIPMLLIIILLSMSAWLIFRITAESYVTYRAKKDLAAMAALVEEQALAVYGSLPVKEGGSSAEQKAQARKLLKQVRQKLKGRTMTAGLAVFNSRMELVYPADKNETEGVIQETDISACREYVLKEQAGGGAQADGEQAPAGAQVVSGAQAPKGEAQTAPEVNTTTERLFEVLQIPSSYRLRAAYFVSYVKVPETNRLFLDTGVLMLGISLGGCLLGAAAAWYVAGSIARPLKKMCRQAELIGEGTLQPEAEAYQLSELEELNRSLHKMQRKLLQAEEEKNIFFQNISHDLKTPLAAITGYAQGIEQGVMKDTRRAAGIILAESLRMTELVEGILMLSKLDSGTFSPDPVPIELGEFLDEALQPLAQIAGKIRIVLHTGSGDYYVLADPGLTVRIFQNIVSNCARYARSEIEIAVNDTDINADGDTDREADCNAAGGAKNNFICVRILDDGEGFSEEALSHAFERFYRGVNGNYGIGLSVVESGMRCMGGSARIKNRTLPETGAVYELWFPRG